MRMTTIGTVAVAGVVALAAGAMAAEPTGAALYQKHCASCHGKDGKGNPKMAKMFKVDPAELDLTGPKTVKATDADLVKIITEGEGKKMPAFGKKMTAAQIKDVVAAIRAFVTPGK